jgi:NAD(P)H-dependent FMN reductase
MKILVVCSTNREGALSRMLANLAVACYNSIDGVEAEILDMSDLGADFLDPKAYKEPSDAVTAVVQRFLACDGAAFIVPEYNGSYPGILKLFVDMLPYPEGFDKRPCSFIGLAAGQFKGLRAVEHFEQVAGYRNAYNYPRRIFIGDSYKQFDFKTGKLNDEELSNRLQQQAEGFVSFIKQVTSSV